MLILIPNKCLWCQKDIPKDKSYGDGLIQMSCEISGLPPFEIKGFLSWCSFEHFLKWYEKNMRVFNVVISPEEVTQQAIMGR